MIRPVVRVEVLRPEAAGQVAVDRQDAAGVVGAEPPVLERRVREAEGEDRSDARLLEPPDGLVGMGRRVHDVRPVDERRDPGVGALERAPQVARVDVVGPVVRGEPVEDAGEIGTQREVRRARPDRGLPGVPVGVDEAGDDDVARRVDHPGSVRGQPVTDGGDPVALDEHVGAGHLAERRVLGEHDPTLDEHAVGHRSFPRLRFARIGWVWGMGLMRASVFMADRSSPALLTQVTGEPGEVGVGADRPFCGPDRLEIDLGLRHRRPGCHRQLADESQVLLGEPQ